MRHVVLLFMFAIIYHTFIVPIFTREASDCVIAEYTRR
jgi:hypothetical protein